MTPEARGQLAVAIEHQYRATMREQIGAKTTDVAEQQEIVDAVLGLMLRKMYLDRGADWLEALLRMVLQPPDDA